MSTRDQQHAMERIAEQREEILAAFIAKYHVEPDECVQRTTTSPDGMTSWWVERLTYEERGFPVDGPSEPATEPTEVLDPWRCRSTGMRCRTCMFFVVKEDPKKRDRDSERGNLGRCRRHAPTMSGFPAVFEIDWCGDHRLDEGKV